MSVIVIIVINIDNEQGKCVNASLSFAFHLLVLAAEGTDLDVCIMQWEEQEQE